MRRALAGSSRARRWCRAGQPRVWCLGKQPGAQRRVGGGQLRESVLQGAEVQHGASHQQRQPLGGDDLRHLPQRVFAELGGGVGLAGVADVDQPMRCTGQQ